MAAVRLALAVELRARWRPWLLVAALAGVAGGVLLAAAAGTRRTESALARHVAAYRFPEVFVGNGDLFSTIRRLPQVASASASYPLAYAARDAHDRPIFSVGPSAMTVEMSADGQDGSRLGLWKILSGRRPDDARSDEALVDSRAAATLGVRAGSTIRLRLFRLGEPVNAAANPATTKLGRLLTFRVVGIRAATDTVESPGGVVRLTPAFYRSADSYEVTGNRMAVRLKHGFRDLASFRTRVHTLGSFSAPESDTTSKIQRSIDLQAQAVWLASGLGALLAVMLLAQSLFRLAAAAAPDHPLLRSLGMTPWQLVARGVGRACIIGGVAAALAVVLAAALSPLTPFGLARELEPSPGFALDPLVLGVGGIAVAALIVLIGALASWRAVAPERAGTSARRASLADVLARWGAPPTAVSGVRLALSQARGRAGAPVRTTVTGAAFAVVVSAAALTFSASLQHLFATPRLFGQTWDYDVLENSSVNRAAIAAALRRDRDVSAAALGADGSDGHLTAGRRSADVGIRGMDNVKGVLDPVVLEGRAPRASDEILVGPRTLHALHAHLGDSVELSASETALVRIVGVGVVAQGIGETPAKGAAMTFEGLRSISPGIPADCCQQLELRIARGVNRDAALRRLERRLGYPSGLPTTIADFGGIRRLPLVLAGLLVALAAGALGHALLITVRRRRRELAILKTLGFDRRQVLATVGWQATSFAVLGVAAGIPLGIAAGRWAWYIFADRLGVVREPVTPLWPTLLVVPGALLLANLVAIVPAWMAARTEPALALRVE